MQNPQKNKNAQAYRYENTCILIFERPCLQSMKTSKIVFLCTELRGTSLQTPAATN